MSPLWNEKQAGRPESPEHYKSRQDGSLFVIAETEPVRGHLSDKLLKEVATVAAVLPRPP